MIDVNDNRVLRLLSAVGTPYHYGKGDLINAKWPPGPCDCSGFAQAALLALGNVRPTAWSDLTAAALLTKCDRIALDQARVGDLAFYGSESRISHVTVCIGGGMTIGANGGSPSTKGDDERACVQVRPIRYRSDFVSVGRLKPAFR